MRFCSHERGNGTDSSARRLLGVGARMRSLTGEARLAGVIGYPVGHSRSPRLHGFWLDRHGIDGAYVPLAVRPDRLAAAVHGLVSSGFVGANVTVPYKEAALALCTEVEPFAMQAGAVNTLVFEGDRIVGTNTDGFGFLANLAASGIVPVPGRPVLLLGAGGAARAIAAALLRIGVPVTIANRTLSRAASLANALPGTEIIAWSDWPTALAGHQILVNTTTLGMTGQPPLAIDLAAAPSSLTVVDIVYVPLRTALLRAADAARLRTVSGLGMLLHQARPGFTAWFGVEPEVDEEIVVFMSAGLPLE